MKLEFRKAEEIDLPMLVQLLSDDELGATREDHSKPLNPRYLEAFRSIDNDYNNQLTVVESRGQLVGMLQLTFIQYLTHVGARRCLIEGVRIARDFRGMGLGSTLIKWAIEQARIEGCSLIQLTSDKQRTDALRFYEALSFKATHEGFKLRL